MTVWQTQKQMAGVYHITYLKPCLSNCGVGLQWNEGYQRRSQWSYFSIFARWQWHAPVLGCKVMNRRNGEPLCITTGILTSVGQTVTCWGLFPQHCFTQNCLTLPSIYCEDTVSMIQHVVQPVSLFCLICFHLISFDCALTNPQCARSVVLNLSEVLHPLHYFLESWGLLTCFISPVGKSLFDRCLKQTVILAMSPCC